MATGKRRKGSAASFLEDNRHGTIDTGTGNCVTDDINSRIYNLPVRIILTCIVSLVICITGYHIGYRLHYKLYAYASYR